MSDAYFLDEHIGKYCLSNKFIFTGWCSENTSFSLFDLILYETFYLDGLYQGVIERNIGEFAETSFVELLSILYDFKLREPRCR